METKQINYNELTKDEINYYLNKEKITLPYMTKFEYSQILGLRLTQLYNNTDSCIDTSGFNNIEDIVKNEMSNRKLPFIICRYLPSGDIELWKVSDLILGK